jgi:hypothetical protein
MARQEQDREDLLAEATALTQRASLRIPGESEPTTVGFRRDASASFYFGASRAYQFTSAGQLRRAFVGELLYKAQRGKLVVMRRERKAGVVELVSHDLDGDAERSFLEETRSHLDKLRSVLNESHFELLGQVPADVDVVARVRAWLETFGGRIAIAQTPRAC